MVPRLMQYRPASKFAVEPGFHAVRHARIVQADVGLDHGRENPGACLAFAARCGHRRE